MSIGCHHQAVSSPPFEDVVVVRAPIWCQEEREVTTSKMNSHAISARFQFGLHGSHRCRAEGPARVGSRGSTARQQAPTRVQR
jgi:hypothetical protein